MDKELEFKTDLKDFNLLEPESKKAYNELLFTPVSRVYSRITGILSFGRDRAWKKKLMKMLPVSQYPSILDIACGPGDLCFLHAKKYPESTITGMDLNSGMLEKANLNLNRYSDFVDRIEFIKGDMNKLPFGDDSFDIITGGYALRNSPDLTQTLKEIKRVLKKDGTAAFLDFSKSSKKGIQGFQVGLIKFWGNIWGWFFHRNPQVYGYIAESLRHFPSSEEFCKLLEKENLEIEIYKSLYMGLLHITLIRKK